MPRTWWAAATVFLLGFVIAWVVVVRVKTSNGMIELVNVPKDAAQALISNSIEVRQPAGNGLPGLGTDDEAPFRE